MKNFVKISLVSLALMLATNANAQLLPISLGIKGGINSSTVSTKGYDSKAGFNAGLTLDVNLPANLRIMSGLEVTTKGAKIQGANQTINAMYLQLPVHLGYKIGIIPGISAHVDLGPYFAQGIAGKTKDADGKKHNTFSDDNMKKFDWGLGAGAGVTFLGKIGVRAGYDFGMANVAQKSGYKVKNRNFYASAVYKFF